MDEKKVFDTEKVVPTYFRLALPVVFSMIITLIYNLADTYFVTRTNNAPLIAGVFLCAPLSTALMAIGNVFGQGGSPLIARLLGKGDQESASRVSAFCFYASICAGIVIAVFLLLLHNPVLRLLGANEQTYGDAKSYFMMIACGAPLTILSFAHTSLLRSEGMAGQSMIASAAGSLLNIALDPLFISGFGWGAFGAALASVIGYTLTDVLCVFFILKKSKVLSVSIHKARVHRDEAGQVFSIGFGAAVANIASSVCVIFMNQYLQQMPDGVDRIAALGIVTRVTMMVVLPLAGFSFGGVPLFGFLYGAGERKKLKQLVRFCTLFLCGFAAVESLAVFLLAGPLMGIFIDDPGIIQNGILIMRWQVSGMVFAAVVLLYTCLFQAGGKSVPALVMSLSRQGVLFIAVFLIATAISGYQGFLASQLTADALSAVLALILYKLSFSREKSITGAPNDRQ